MTTSIKMPLHTFTPTMVQDLQEKYPQAVVYIEVEENTETPKMDEDRFWEIIAKLDWGRKRNEDITAPAVKQLGAYEVEDIFRFEEILAQKLYALDGAKYAAALGWNGPETQNFSVDGFLYARCCVVANGKAFFEKVLNDAAIMPQNSTFEPLLYLAEKAFKLKTGTDDFDYLPEISYETFSNAEGWPGVPSLKELLKGDEAPR